MATCGNSPPPPGPWSKEASNGPRSPRGSLRRGVWPSYEGPVGRIAKAAAGTSKAAPSTRRILATAASRNLGTAPSPTRQESNIGTGKSSAEAWGPLVQLPARMPISTMPPSSRSVMFRSGPACSSTFRREQDDEELPPVDVWAHAGSSSIMSDTGRTGTRSVRAHPCRTTSSSSTPSGIMLGSFSVAAALASRRATQCSPSFMERSTWLRPAKGIPSSESVREYFSSGLLSMSSRARLRTEKVTTSPMRGARRDRLA
mmetsp:Transcript_25687/g.45571  ORF Transcript_25687/g.45571 Transcript_25687/m.45571 type:complete len:258 (+) Transcript_25687:1279-2052(+)